MRLLVSLLMCSTISLLSACNDTEIVLEKSVSSAHKVEVAAVATTKKSALTEAILNNYKTVQVAPHSYVIHGPLEMPNKANKGFMNNPGFVITDKSVVVVDPGSSVQVGRELVARIKAMTSNPITHVFSSHVHGDHWLGNQAIKEAYPKAAFYAHPVMIEKASTGDAEHWIELMDKLTGGATKGTEAVIPVLPLSNGQTVEVDGMHFIAHLSEKAHTETDAMIELTEDKLLFTGDNVTHNRLPRMTDGSFGGNIAAAEMALKLDLNVVVPGHGLTGDKKVIEGYMNYLTIILNNVARLGEEDLEGFEMKPIIIKALAQYKDWSGFEDQVGKHINLAITEFEESSF